MRSALAIKIKPAKRSPDHARLCEMLGYQADEVSPAALLSIMSFRRSMLMHNLLDWMAKTKTAGAMYMAQRRQESAHA